MYSETVAQGCARFRVVTAAVGSSARSQRFCNTYLEQAERFHLHHVKGNTEAPSQTVTTSAPQGHGGHLAPFAPPQRRFQGRGEE